MGGILDFGITISDLLGPGQVGMLSLKKNLTKKEAVAKGLTKMKNKIIFGLVTFVRAS